MKQSIQEWIQVVLQKDEVEGKQVLEVGSMNVNGTVRPYVESLNPKGYWGIDMREGPGVDDVLDCQNIALAYGSNSYDIVISTEMLEHAEYWQDCIWNMVEVLTTNGILILTTVSPGFPKHDFPNDYHRFTDSLLTRELMYRPMRDFVFYHDDDFGIFVKAYKK